MSYWGADKGPKRLSHAANVRTITYCGVRPANMLPRFGVDLRLVGGGGVRVPARERGLERTT